MGRLVEQFTKKIKKNAAQLTAAMGKGRLVVAVRNLKDGLLLYVKDM